MKTNFGIKITSFLVLMMIGMSGFAQGLLVNMRNGSSMAIDHNSLDYISTYEQKESMVFPGEKVPQIYEVVNYAMYQHGVKSLAESGEILFNYKGSVVVFRCQKDQRKYCIKSWLGNPNGLFFTVDPNTQEIMVPTQPTGYSFTKYGPIFCTDVKTGGFAQDLKSVKDGDDFIFYMAYTVKAGAVGFEADVMTIPSAKSNKMQNTFNIKEGRLVEFKK